MEQHGQAKVTNPTSSRVHPSGLEIREHHNPSTEIECTAWDVYNNEARRVDTELVKDWRESLNFLLVFAAIFSAVLTAFILESMKLLQQDWPELVANATVFGIQNAANLSAVAAYIPPEFEATPEAVSINCLLFASLGSSVFAALISVVALQWVVDYDAVVTRGGSSQVDLAKRRQFRYAGVVTWRMGELIALLPLLVHLSVLLFWTGLAIWIGTINPTVGQVVAAGAIIAVILYLLITVIAAVFISAPFRTPLSRGVYWLFKPMVSLIYGWLPVVDFKRQPQWFKLLHRKASLFLKPLHKFITDTTQLLHVMEIAAWIKRNLVPHDTALLREQEATGRDRSLKEQALCWLASQLPISIRSHHQLLLLVEEVPRHSARTTPSPRFFKAPWWNILDFLGRLYVQKTLDATLSEEEQTTGVAALVRWSEIPNMMVKLAPNKKYSNDSSAVVYRNTPNSSSKQEQSVPRNAAFLLAKDIPHTLSRLIVQSPYPEDRHAAVAAFDKWAEHDELQAAICATVPLLIKQLHNLESRVRCSAAAAIGNLANHERFHEVINTNIPSLVEMLEQPSNASSRSGAGAALGTLIDHATFWDAIRPAVPLLIEGLKDEDKIVQSDVTCAVRSVAEYVELCDMMPLAVPSLVEQLTSQEPGVRSAAADSLVRLAKHTVVPELRVALIDSVPALVALLQGEQPWATRLVTAEVLGSLANHEGFHEKLGDIIPEIVGLLTDSKWDTRSIASIVLDKFAAHGFQAILCKNISKLVVLLQTQNPHVQSAVADVLRKLAKYAELRGDIGVAILPLIELLKNSEPDVREAAASTLGKLAFYPEFRSGIDGAIPLLVERFTRSDSSGRLVVVSTLGILAENEAAHEAMGSAIQPLIEGLKDSDTGVRCMAASVLGKLAEHAKEPDPICDAVRPLIILLGDSAHRSAQSAAASAIGHLARHRKLRSEILATIPQLIGRLEDPDPYVRSDSASALANLAEYSQLRGAIRPAILPAIRLLRDGNFEAQSAAASALGTFAKHQEFRGEVSTALVPLTKLLRSHQNWMVRSSAAQALGGFADHATELGHAMNVAIQSLIECLKEDGIKDDAASTLDKLAARRNFGAAMGAAIIPLMELLEDREDGIRSIATSVLCKIAKQAELHDGIRAAIPTPIGYLTNPKHPSYVRVAAASLLGDLAEHTDLHDSLSPARPPLTALLKDARGSGHSAVSSALDRFNFYGVS